MPMMCAIPMLALLLQAAPPQTTQAPLTGKRLILQGSKCAGWQFTTAETAVRYDEMDCGISGDSSFQARIHWTGPDQFLLIEATKPEPVPPCPPRVWCYKIESISDTQVTLKEVWLGWGKRKDSLENYRIKK